MGPPQDQRDTNRLKGPSIRLERPTPGWRGIQQNREAPTGPPDHMGLVVVYLLTEYPILQRTSIKVRVCCPDLFKLILKLVNLSTNSDTRQEGSKQSKRKGGGHEVKEAPSLSEGIPKDCRGRISGKMDPPNS